MRYTGLYKKMYSTLANENVSILKYESADNIPYCTCSRCGKPIKRKMFVVQSEESGVEMFYLGAECIKKFS